MLCFRADWPATLSYKNLDPPLLIKAPAFLRYSQVHRESGKVEIGDSVFDSLPYLVAELRKSWMKDLQPVTHS